MPSASSGASSLTCSQPISLVIGHHQLRAELHHGRADTRLHGAGRHTIELADLTHRDGVEAAKTRARRWSPGSRASGSRSSSASTTCTSARPREVASPPGREGPPGSSRSKRRAGSMLIDTLRAMVSTHAARVPRRGSWAEACLHASTKLLRRFLCCTVIAEDREGQPEHPTLETAHEDRGRVGFPSSETAARAHAPTSARNRRVPRSPGGPLPARLRHRAVGSRQYSPPPPPAPPPPAKNAT